MLKKLALLAFVQSFPLFSLENDSSLTLDQIANQNVFGEWQGKVTSASVKSGFFCDLSFLYLKPEVEGLTFGKTLDIVTPHFSY